MYIFSDPASNQCLFIASVFSLCDPRHLSAPLNFINMLFKQSPHLLLLVQLNLSERNAEVTSNRKTKKNFIPSSQREHLLDAKQQRCLRLRLASLARTSSVLQERRHHSQTQSALLTLTSRGGRVMPIGIGGCFGGRRNVPSSVFSFADKRTETVLLFEVCSSVASGKEDKAKVS